MLRLVNGPRLAPRIQPVFVSYKLVGPLGEIDAAGFPEAWVSEADAVRDYSVRGSCKAFAVRNSPDAPPSSPAPGLAFRPPCARPADGPHGGREVGEGRTARQPGQVRKEAALTRQGRAPQSHPHDFPPPTSLGQTAAEPKTSFCARSRRSTAAPHILRTARHSAMLPVVATRPKDWFAQKTGSICAGSMRPPKTLPRWDDRDRQKRREAAVREPPPFPRWLLNRSLFAAATVEDCRRERVEAIPEPRKGGAPVSGVASPPLAQNDVCGRGGSWTA